MTHKYSVRDSDLEIYRYFVRDSDLEIWCIEITDVAEKAGRYFLAECIPPNNGVSTYISIEELSGLLLFTSIDDAVKRQKYLIDREIEK